MKSAAVVQEGQRPLQYKSLPLQMKFQFEKSK